MEIVGKLNKFGLYGTAYFSGNPIGPFERYAIYVKSVSSKTKIPATGGSVNWKGTELKTYPEIIDFALSLPPIEQGEFVEAYAKSGPHALSNIGYFSGYYEAEKAIEIQEIFKTSHPFFGRRTPTVEEAFEKGKQMGQAIRNKGRDRL